MTNFVRVSGLISDNSTVAFKVFKTGSKMTSSFQYTDIALRSFVAFFCFIYLFQDQNHVVSLDKQVPCTNKFCDKFHDVKVEQNVRIEVIKKI